MYDDGKGTATDEQGSIEDCKKLLRQEVIQNANGRNYMIVVRDKGNTLFYYNSETGKKVERQ